MTEPDDHPSLNYAHGKPAPQKTSGIAILLFAGILCGVISTIVAGFVLALVTNEISDLLKHPLIVLITTAIGCFAIAIGCFVKAVRVIMNNRTKWLLIGFLLGAGIMGLIEGVCFASLA